MTTGDLAAVMAAHADRIEAELAALLAPSGAPAETLGAAMRHATLGGGKRLRPFMVHAAAAAGRADQSAVLRVGAAIELVHCYSLVHDDLPAMDDADTRRGRPSCHKAFGEATAILAGDALLTLAFEVLARDDWPAEPGLRCRMIAGLARAAGMAGMCGGQLLDLEAEHSVLDEAGIATLQQLKTGALIAFACEAGGRLAGFDEEQLAALLRYGRALGLAFQIADDLLDATAEAPELGKPVGQDEARNKATLVRLLGIDGARARLAAAEAEGIGALDKLGQGASLLREVLSFVINRRV